MSSEFLDRFKLTFGGASHDREDNRLPTKEDVADYIDVIEEENDRLRVTLEMIEQWSRAYPLDVFPKPDLKKAHEVLKAADMTLDAISADAMRHVVTQVGELCRKVLEIDETKKYSSNHPRS